MTTAAPRLAVALAWLCAPSATAAQDSGPVSPEAHLSSLVHNVVRVQAERAGFGFLVGLRGDELLIATARHTLGDTWDARPTVCFPPRGEVCRDATVAYWADPIGNQPALDLVILAVPDPGELAWRPDVEGAAAEGDPVWVIGRSGQWWISPEPGTVTARDPDRRHLLYRDLDVAPGVSGAPVIGRDGVVAMHLQEARSEGEARGLDIAAIRERVTERVEGRWILVPPATCEDVPAPVATLAGRGVLVGLDPRAPDAALRAMARLHCIGSRALPRPVPDPAGWPGSAIVYRSGDLRAARALQLLLAPHGRIETRLGDGEGDLEVWLR